MLDRDRKGLTDAPPGTARGLQVVVEDAAAARAELVERGVDATDVQEYPWGRFVFFEDPDGNRWAIQEITIRDSRVPSAAANPRFRAVTGRMCDATPYVSPVSGSAALR